MDAYPHGNGDNQDGEKDGIRSDYNSCRKKPGSRLFNVRSLEGTRFRTFFFSSSSWKGSGGLPVRKSERGGGNERIDRFFGLEQC